jgi:hypothetical protein
MIGRKFFGLQKLLRNVNQCECNLDGRNLPAEVSRNRNLKIASLGTTGTCGARVLFRFYSGGSAIIFW